MIYLLIAIMVTQLLILWVLLSISFNAAEVRSSTAEVRFNTELTADLTGQLVTILEEAQRRSKQYR